MKKFKKSLPILMAISSLFGSVANASESGGAKQKRTGLDNAVTTVSCLAIAPSLLMATSKTCELCKDYSTRGEHRAAFIVPQANELVRAGSFIVEEATKGKTKTVSKLVNYCSSYAAILSSTVFCLINAGNAASKLSWSHERKQLEVMSGMDGGLAVLGGASMIMKTIRDLKQSK